MSPSAQRPPKPAKQAADAAPALTRKQRTEVRNDELRSALKPLGSGERPLAVTIAALIALLLAIGNAIAYAAGMTVNGERPTASSIVAPEIILVVCAAGMWQAKYWAVLGFQFLLGLLLAFLALFALRVSSLRGGLVVIGLGVPAGALFWFLIKSMARIQMPQRPQR